ncbi:MAG: Phospho-N-acetylmuramoyl-pentapeptide-transferase [Parcubacteria group bacterium Gr01-1014_46]|nr:MAG: Phospho-N-acetylmuramoyl-pentapeptide-transferase [Parcubacteria group bacterium Gr01-1014_46]
MTDVLKVVIPSVLTFFIAISITPVLTHYLYKYKMWKKRPRIDDSIDGLEEMSLEFKRIQNANDEVRTPRPGGIVVWLSVLLCITILYLISKFSLLGETINLDFFSRNQTLLLVFTLLTGSTIGLVDDLLTINAKKGIFVNGFPRVWMVGIVLFVGLISGLWFFLKLDVSMIHVPFGGDLELGWLIVPFFLLVFFGTFSSGVIDGIDGLAAGVMSTIFTAFGIIAFFQNQIDIAAFCVALTGALLAFLWFNIPPARFYLGETGMLGLVFTLPIVAFLTNQILVFPVIALLLVVTSLSSFIQIISKKIWGPAGKVFRVAPLHHHFEAIGWSKEKVVMRYWVVGVVASIIGVIVAFTS